MRELIRRGESGGQVSDWNPSSDTITAPSQQSFFAPHGLTLQQTITSSGAVTIPAGIEWVYVVAVGGGNGGYFQSGGKSGYVAWGWTLAQNTCIIGAGGAQIGGYTRYGHIISLVRNSNAAADDGADYFGRPAGRTGVSNAAAFGVVGGIPASGDGPDGISGGGGAGNITAGVAAGKGGNGLTAGGGGSNNASSGTRIGGAGGNAYGIDGTLYTGGAGGTNNANVGAGGGGAGIAGNGTDASGQTAGVGGLGGGGGGARGSDLGGVGGAGILYIWY